MSVTAFIRNMRPHANAPSASSSSSSALPPPAAPLRSKPQRSGPFSQLRAVICPQLPNRSMGLVAICAVIALFRQEQERWEVRKKERKDVQIMLDRKGRGNVWQCLAQLLFYPKQIVNGQCCKKYGRLDLCVDLMHFLSGGKAHPIADIIYLYFSQCLRCSKRSCTSETDSKKYKR